MKLKATSLFLGLALLFVLVSSGFSQVTNTIVITNASFENPAVTEGNYETASLPNWSTSISGSAVYAVINPGGTGTSEPWPSTSPVGMNGTNFCQLFAYGANGGCTIYQDTGVKYAAGVNYQLTAAFGLQTNAQFFATNSTMLLYNSSLAVIASNVINSATLIKGAFTNRTLSYTGTGSEGGNGDVVVGFSMPASPAQSYFDFDNVQLIAITNRPAITTQPSSQTVNQGANASFSVVASGPAPLSYQWQTNNVNVGNGGIVSGATSSTLTLTGATPSWALNYRVIVSNTGGSVTSSPSATLTVTVPPAITTQPSSQTVNQGANASFSVVASGTAPLSYQWQTNNVNVGNGGIVAGATTSSLTLTGVTSSWALNYRVIVSNAAGSVTSSPAATLTVIVPPAITTQPSSQTVNQGANVSFSVVATGTAPLSYQWQTNNVNVGNGGIVSGATTSSLTLTGVTPSWALNYRVIISNAAGSVTSSPAATLTVTVPPAITTQPSSQTVNQGANASFSVVAAGTAPLSYQWQTNNVNVGNGGIVAGATTSSLTLTGVTPSWALNYRVIISNAAGSVTSSPAATLTVIVPPTITTQPSSQTVNQGANVSFTVVATGSAPLTYQWQTNGVNVGNGGIVAGATTSSLTLTGVTATWALNYQVIVANAAGSVTSSPAATLTVNVPPTITTQPASQSAYLGQNTSFNVVATGTAPLTYQWQANSGTGFTNVVNGGPVSGATSSTLAITGVTTNWALTYEVVVANGGGSVTSSPATLTISSVNSTLVDVQFDGSYNFATAANATGPVQSGASVLGSSGDQWTVESVPYYVSSGTPISAAPLLNNTGAGSGLTLTVTQPGNPIYTGTYPGSSYGAVDAGTSNLMSSVLETFNYYTYPGYINFSIGGLSAYTNYAFNLVVYAGDPVIQTETITVTGGAIGGNTGNALTTTSISRQLSAGSGVAYNVYAGTLTGGNLTFQVAGGGQNGRLGVNGFQLLLAPTLPPIITANPVAQSVYPGQNVTLSASAVGATSYQWQAGPVGGPYTNLVNGGQISGATTSTLNIANVSSSWALTYQLLAYNSVGSVASAPATLTVLPPLYSWGSPVAFNGQTAGQILTNPPGTVVGAVAFGNATPVTVYPGGNYAPVVFDMFADPTVASVTSPSGILYGTGSYPAGTGNSTGDTNLNSVLNNFAYNGSPLTIKLINLVPGQTYSVQLFAVDDRSGASSELVNFQNASSTFAENTNAYVLANFTVPASTNTVTLQENLPNGIGTINALVVRAVSFTPAINFTLQPTSVSPDLGDTVTFSAMATGPAPLVPHWQSGPAGGPYTNLVDTGHITGSGTYNLTIANVTSSDASLQYVLNLTSGTNSVNSQAAGISVFGIGGTTVYVAPGGDVNGNIYNTYLSGGGTVLLGAGTYYGTINMFPNVCLKGAGMGVTTIIGTLTQGQYGYTMSMEDLTVEGGISASSYSQGGYPGAGIFFGAYYPNNSGVLSWKNVEVKGENIAMQIINASTVTLTGCNFHDNGLGFSHSIYFTGDYGVSMNNCISSWTYTGDGAHLDFSSNIGVPNTFTQCEFNGATGIGILNQNYNGSGNDIHINGCKFQFNGQSGGDGSGVDTDLAGYISSSRLEYNHGYGAMIRDSVGLFYDVFNGNSSDLYYSYGPVAYIVTGSSPYSYDAAQADGICGPNNTGDWVTGIGGETEGVVTFSSGTHPVNGSITWSTVSAPTTGTYFLAVTYANGSTNTQAMPITVNGAYAGTMLFPPTGGGTTYKVTGQYATLTSSNNSVTLNVLSPGLGSPTLANLSIYTTSAQTPTIPSAPATPTGLTWYANTNAPRLDMTTWITLNWNAVPGETYYNIYRNGLPIARNLTTPTFTDKHILGCNAGETYQVTAENAGGEGGYASVSAVSLAAYPLSLTATASTNSVILGCSASPGAVSYKVYRATTSGGPYSLVGTSTNNAYIDTGVTVGTTYYYVMTALNGTSESLYSPEASAKPYSPYAGSPVLINVDFGTGATQTGVGVLGSAGDTWNAVTGTTGTLVNSGGSTVSGVGLSLGGAGLYNDTGGSTMDSATTPLMQDYAYGYSGSTPTITVSLTGMTAYAGANLTLVIYAAGDTSGQGATLNLSGASGGNTGSALTTSATSRQISAGSGVAYNTFTGTVGGSGTLTFTANIPSGQSFTTVNGFQLYLTAP